ncbi:hypothetical protein C8J57DRAFT_1269285 [Mycena rebaudengoi]|nr:hypothetical protein C8J57DRAFT_1269285 [Mycena rebaudengoi]
MATTLDSAFLRLVHSFHFLITLLSACWHRFIWIPPRPLQVTRRRLPEHLALLLVPDATHDSNATREFLLENVSRTVGWCRVVGIKTLTVYDTEGLIVDCAEKVSQRVTSASQLDGYESSGSDTEYPLTPPSSDCSDSRPLSPEDGVHSAASITTLYLHEVHPKRTRRKYGLKKRQRHSKKADNSQQPLTLHIASRQSSKPAIAAAATCLARRRAQSAHPKPCGISVESLNSILEGPHSLSPPDFLILHDLRPSTHLLAPLELHGFPPWHVRLTEIYDCKNIRLPDWLSLMWKGPENSPQLLEEIDFRAALDEFAGAEMRFGK